MRGPFGRVRDQLESNGEQTRARTSSRGILEATRSPESPIRHVAVMFNASAAAERALLEAAAIADEHDAQLTVITSVPHDRRMVCCAACHVGAGYWNAVMDEVAEADLAKARAILGAREPEPRCRAVSGSGASEVRREAARLRCDLLVLPDRRRFRRAVRRLPIPRSAPPRSAET
jgi:nucleotide-binding universal stress UspA family protein